MNEDGIVEQEEVKVEMFNKQRTPEQKSKRLKIGMVCLIIAFLITCGIFATRNDNPMLGSKIVFADGCEEVYNFDGEMTSEQECTEGRRLAKEYNEKRKLNTPEGIGGIELEI